METMGLDAEARGHPGLPRLLPRGRLSKHLVAIDAVHALGHAASGRARPLLRLGGGAPPQGPQPLGGQDPDFVIAFNGINFDNPFLNTRARRKDAKSFYYLSRYALHLPAPENNLSSAGRGDNIMYYFDTPVARRWTGTSSCGRTSPVSPASPSTTLSKSLEEKMPDMSYKLIPEYQRGTAETRAKLGVYCVRTPTSCASSRGRAT